MSSQKPTGATSMLDPDLIVLDRLGTLATMVLGEHHADAGLCTVCGSSWPCEQVVLADHNLAVL